MRGQGSWRSGREEEAGVLQLKPSGPLAAEEGDSQETGEDAATGKGGACRGKGGTWSWRSVYCQDVTPGALSMKRRALVMRKLICWEEERCSLNPQPPRRPRL